VDDLDLDGPGSAGAGGFALASIGEDDAPRELGEGFLVDLPLDDGAVGLGDAVARVGEAVGEFAVVGEEEEACGVVVEAADGEELRLGRVADEVEDGAAVGAGLVLGGGEGSGGLV